MALTPEEVILFEAALEESALAINDAIVATTAQQKLDAKLRYKNAQRVMGKQILQFVKHGIQGDY